MHKLILCSFIMAFFAISCSQPNRQTQENDTRVEMTLEEVWATDSVLKTPESVIYDREKKVLYVSNINEAPAEKDGNGFISKLSLQGGIIEMEWVTGLHGPKGMGIHQGKLYVTDIDELVEIDIENGTITNKYPVEGAVFLNDLTVSDNGTVYFSDSRGGKIFQMDNGNIEIFMDQGVEGTNGLLFHSDTLYALINGEQAFTAIDPKTKAKTVISPYEGRGDGVVLAKGSAFIISDWEGQIFYWANNEMKTLLNTKDQKINTADIEYLIDENLLLIPTFADNRVVAYKLVEKKMDSN